MAVPELISDPEQIGAEWLTQVLRASGAVSEARVVGVALTIVGTGQMGENVRFDLEYDRAEAGVPGTVVGKFPSSDPTSRATAASQGSYVREVRFYQQVAATVDIRTPRCFYAEIDLTSNQFALIMEDLAPARQGDQLEGCSVDQAAVALEELAKLHAPRWGDSALAKIEWLPRRSVDGAKVLGALYGSVWPGFVERYGAQLEADSLALAEKFGANVEEWALYGAEAATTVVHGDYRVDNMLFATPAGGHPVTVVDWQTLGEGRGVGDASYFLGASLRTEDRRKHERDLLREYHGLLLAGGVTDLDWDLCWEEYRRHAFGGLLMSVVASMIVLQSERGDAMFTTMARRHSRHAIDLGCEEFFVSA